MRKLTRSQMRAFMIAQLARQSGECPLCTLPIDLRIRGEACTDHNHQTGEIRGVLHRSCNAALGKMEHAVGRWGSKDGSYAAMIPWIKRAVAYYDTPGLGVIYPMHKTEEEKRLLRNSRARDARAAKKARTVLVKLKGGK